MEAINRTFVGILIPAELAAQVQAQVQVFKRKPGVDSVRWSAPSEYLIQLASLGELSPMTLHRLGLVLPEALSRLPSFRVEIARFGGTPNAIQPRFVHAELEGDLDKLEQLAQAIDREVAPLLPNRDIQGFRPRIPLGRLKTESEQLRVALGRALKMTPIPPMGSLAVHQVDLLISKANEFGIGYESVARMPLANF